MITIKGKNKLEDFIWKSYKKNKVIVIYFGAIWCGPCKMLKDRLNSEEAKFDMPNLSICYVDIDEEDNEELSISYNVKSLPLQIFIKLDGNKIVEIKKILGYDWINFLITYNSINEEKENKNENEYEEDDEDEGNDEDEKEDSDE